MSVYKSQDIEGKMQKRGAVAFAMHQPDEFDLSAKGLPFWT
jgi:hypothetical protein